MNAQRSRARRAGHGLLALMLLVASVACGSSSPTAPSNPCSFTLSSNTQAFAAGGGQGTVSVATGATCAWSVTGADGWVTLTSPLNATGPGTVSYSIAVNAADAARDKTLTIATLPFTVRQDGAAACRFTVDPERHQSGSKGGTATVTVTTASNCSWESVSRVPWIVIEEGANGRGPGTVRYRVAENNTTLGRTGTLTVATRTHTVDQDGETAPLTCDYKVGPVEFAPCMEAGTLTATISTGSSCTWSATTDHSWLSIIEGGSGTGDGTIRVRYTDNYLAPRNGTVMVRWPSPSLGQNVRIAQAGCRYGVSREAIDAPSAGGPLTFDVLQESDPNTCGGALQDRCVWTARSDVSWITVVTTMPQTGDHGVTLSVAPNTGAARSGHVTVGDRTVTVSQADGT